MPGMWVVCDECGSVVADLEKHEAWHSQQPQTEET
mgnify:CR=1 FL=1